MPLRDVNETCCPWYGPLSHTEAPPTPVQLFLRGSESGGREEPKWLVSFVCFILLLIMSLKSAQSASLRRCSFLDGCLGFIVSCTAATWDCFSQEQLSKTASVPARLKKLQLCLGSLLSCEMQSSQIWKSWRFMSAAKKTRLKKNPAGHKKVNINNKNDLWITHTLSYRNNGKTVPPHSDTTEYQTVCVASFRPPNYGAFLRTYSQLSQVRFLHTWGKRNSTCDTDVRQAGACFERSGSCSSERVKQKKRSMKSDKESDHRFCCRKHLVYILLLSYLFNDIQNVHKNITSAAFLEKQSL